ncbi:MAG: hypothetical protein COA50_01175 [Flavobacteriaceae bacterium]|nr:MAG: hypothetical protein COA50_01175 [Flavobacteriaceae bacterium]
MNKYKQLTIQLIEAREQFDNGDITLEDFEKILKGLYEDYLKLEKKQNEKERKEMVNLLFAT